MAVEGGVMGTVVVGDASSMENRKYSQICQTQMSPTLHGRY